MLTNTDQALVSILVNCYNSEAFLKQALDSIYKQTYQNFEIILVDNCSTDRTFEITQNYDKRLRYFKTQKNIPLYAARNMGLVEVQGQYLCVLDSDDYWVPTKLQLQIDLMKSNSKIDLIYTAYESHYETLHKSFFKKVYLQMINYSDNHFETGFVSQVQILKNYNVNFQTIMMKVSILKGLNFDDRFNLVGDLDLIYRLIWLHQVQIYYINQKTAFSRIHERQLSRKSDLRWVIECLKLFAKIKVAMTQPEQKLYRKYFVLFYYSSHLLRLKKYRSALLIKSKYIFTSLKYTLHFLKSVLTSLKGS